MRDGRASKCHWTVRGTSHHRHRRRVRRGNRRVLRADVRSARPSCRDADLRRPRRGRDGFGARPDGRTGARRATSVSSHGRSDPRKWGVTSIPSWCVCYSRRAAAPYDMAKVLTRSGSALSATVRSRCHATRRWCGRPTAFLRMPVFPSISKVGSSPAPGVSPAPSAAARPDRAARPPASSARRGGVETRSRSRRERVPRRCALLRRRRSS